MRCSIDMIFYRKDIDTVVDTMFTQLHDNLMCL